MRFRTLILPIIQGNLVNFKYPDPVLDINADFCPIDEISSSNATIRCSDSANNGSICKFKCPNGFELLGPGEGSDECQCSDGDCNWLGSTRFSTCYNLDFLFAKKVKQPKLLEIVNLKSAGNEMEMFGTKDIDDMSGIIDEDLFHLSINDLQDQYKSNKDFEHLPRTERGFARKQHQDDLRKNYRKSQKYKALLEEQDSFGIGARGSRLDASIPTCKPLSLLNGRIDCKKDGKMLSRDGRFQQGAECSNSCSVGFILRKNAPIAKKCICRGRNGCKWVRNAQAKCIRVSGKNSKDSGTIGRQTTGRQNSKNALPWCVSFENGKKKMVRNKNCACPLGWSDVDKCFTPVTNKIASCKLTDNFVISGIAILNCYGVRKETFPNVDFIVPGTITELNLSNSGIMELFVNVAEGAYRLESFDISHNYFRAVPRDFFKTNQMLKKINLSHNQLRAVRPDIISGLKELQEFNLSNNQLSVLNKKFLKGAYNLKILDLSNNQILQLSKWGLRKLPNLRVVHLSGNKLKTVGNMIFEDTKRLEEVDFSNNRLKTISAKTFDKKNIIKKLNYSQNQIGYLPATLIQNIKNVQDLNFENNNIKILKPEMFIDAKNLNKLILNDNRLTSLPDKLFLENGCALKALFIKGNKLNFMNQKALEPCDALRYLFLSDNLITKLPPKLLSGKPVLKTVDLSRNQIQEIPGGFTKENAALENLYLNENSIRDFPLDVLENNKKLKVMDLHKNDIQNITGTLTESQKGRNGEFANVNLLDLRDNKKIGDIAKLFHSDSSWYAKFGNMETHQNPIDLFTSHVRTRSLLERSQKPNEEKNSISKIIERRLNMDFDEPWLNKENKL